MGRTACAFVPRFELALRARAEPELWGRCLAVVDWASGTRRESQCDPLRRRAWHSGREIASRPSQMAGLVMPTAPRCRTAREGRTRDHSRSAVGLLASSGLGWSRVLLPGSRGAGANLAQPNRAAGAPASLFVGLGLPARLAIAETPFLSHGWEAQHESSGRLVPSAVIDPTTQEAGCHWKPFRSPCSESQRSARELCALLGLRSAGNLSRLPKGALAERLGKEGAKLERLCRGEAFPLWPTVQKMPRANEAVELDLELAIEGLEPLLLALQSLLERLLATVGAERKALVELTVRVRLDDRSQVVERFVPERPTLKLAGLLDLLRLWLERRPFADRVASLRLEASRVAPADVSQLSLLRQARGAGRRRARPGDRSSRGLAAGSGKRRCHPA